MDVMVETSPIRAILLHRLYCLGRHEEGSASSPVPIIHPLVVDESIQIAEFTAHCQVIVEWTLIPPVVDFEVLLQIDGIDRIPEPHRQGLCSDHDDSALVHCRGDVVQKAEEAEVTNLMLMVGLPDDSSHLAGSPLPAEKVDDQPLFVASLPMQDMKVFNFCWKAGSTRERSSGKRKGFSRRFGAAGSIMSEDGRAQS
eukprot:CAMPEP_0115764320 /NCGR_PEP_ID=MMETSP0272-20121206/101996_1 /TAXON_ID=71861 /ORGANISM="Scrippsiella trochoidea, Strain CCMP3099" /LENGTH=197 /DNA_ID=CAMNT_0003210097 /DNA_START=170 /DNA_END=764 /DNA_ORIENTATION=+